MSAPSEKTSGFRSHVFNAEIKKEKEMMVVLKLNSVFPMLIHRATEENFKK